MCQPRIVSTETSRPWGVAVQWMMISSIRRVARLREPGQRKCGRRARLRLIRDRRLQGLARVRAEGPVGRQTAAALKCLQRRARLWPDLPIDRHGIAQRDQRGLRLASVHPDAPDVKKPARGGLD